MSPEQEAKLNEIHRALVGEPAFKREGIIEKVERHEVWISNAKVRIAGIMGGAAVLMFLVMKAEKLIEWVIK